MHMLLAVGYMEAASSTYIVKATGGRGTLGSMNTLPAHRGAGGCPCL